MILIANALLSGSGLGEYWTLQQSDVRSGIVPLVRDGWLHDTHPPFFNLWSAILSSMGIESIPLARLLTNSPPLIMMIAATRHLIRRSPEQYIFHAAFLLLVLSVPPTIWAFATYQSYFWQIAALTILIQIGRHIAMADADLSAKRDAGLAPIAVFAVAGSIMFQYVGGLIGAVVTLAIILCAMAKGFKRWVALLIKAIAVAGLITAFFAWYQAGYWIAELDHSWAQPDSGSGISDVIGLVVNAILHNPLPLIGLLWLWRNWNYRDGIFLVTMIAALVVALLILFQIDVQKPIIIARYMVGVPVIMCAAMAVPATPFARDRRLYGLLAAISVGAVIIPFFVHGPDKRWNAEAKQIAKIQKECPSARIYAATGWLLRDGADSRTARREDPVFARGYAHLGASYGFTPQIIGRNGPTQALPGLCPTLLWIEHVPNGTGMDARKIMKATGLIGLDHARLSIIRGESGLIVRADRQ